VRRTRCSTRRRCRTIASTDCARPATARASSRPAPRRFEGKVKGKVYPLARSNPGVYASIRALQIPVLVIRARPQDPSILPWDPLGTPTFAGLAQEFRHGRDIQLMDKTHMLPMEDPALTARLIAEAIAEVAT
jgi:pimeloyl-ACP methyl ester carboxylesterase